MDTFLNSQIAWCEYMGTMHVRLLAAIRSAVYTRSEVLISSSYSPRSTALRLALDSAAIAERITSRWHDWLERRRDQWLLDEQALHELGVTRG